VNLLRLLAVVSATGLVATACGLVSSPADAIDLTVAVSSDSLIRGTETVVIHVSARNPTTRTLRFDGGGCLLRFEIHDAAGHVVAPDVIACPAILRHVRLEPNDSLTTDYRWHGERWTNAIPQGAPPPELLPAGRYRIYGVLDAIGDRQRSAATLVELMAPPATP
jgi:hypothetical protein